MESFYLSFVRSFFRSFHSITALWTGKRTVHPPPALPLHPPPAPSLALTGRRGESSIVYLSPPLSLCLLCPLSSFRKGLCPNSFSKFEGWTDGRTDGRGATPERNAAAAKVGRAARVPIPSRTHSLSLGHNGGWTENRTERYERTSTPTTASSHGAARR